MSCGTDTHLGYGVSKVFFEWITCEVRYEGQGRHRHAYIRERKFHTKKPANKSALKPKEVFCIYKIEWWPLLLEDCNKK